ncbi:PKD domain-containing protein [Congregibacter variabilis]|uniref:PKD domain-containing protein n=1 Tax=Congregibacter variabilis TaxID=3081200 RepID=A0ABZ0I4B6_9GAMM|nr:PKD domain-containing protein [Congregibacter sp. IMCC43200]
MTIFNSPRGRLRALALVCSSLIYTSVSAAPPVDKFPDIELPDVVSGQAAVGALGAKLPPVAAFYGMSTSEFARHLRDDRTLWIDRSGRAFYIEPEPADSFATDILEEASYPLSETFLLESKPTAPRTVYLDFDGHVTSGTAWNGGGGDITSPAYDRNGDPSFFTNSELTEIQAIWRLVAEDFAPFNVNVTTRDPGPAAISRDGSGDGVFGTRVVFTVDNFDGCGCGGFAYLRAFDDTSDFYKPAFVFNRGVKGAGEAATHEAGHNLGLNHDGISGGAAYYGGHGSGSTGWAAIMGVGYNRSLVQWSSGEYNNANNLEDDLARMQVYGAPLVEDDHGDSIGGASALESSRDGTQVSLAARGVVHTRDDLDVFSLIAGAGPLNLSLTPAPSAPNLDIEARLLDASGNELARSNPESALDAAISVNVAAGEYFLVVDGVGKGDPLGTGYTDYASLGNYSIAGFAADPGGIMPPIAVATAPNYTASIAPLSVDFDASGSSDAVFWDWDFGDGGTDSVVAPRHIYTAPGVYAVTLTVTNESGLTDSTGLEITVNNQPPVAVASANTLSAAAGDTIVFDGSASYDVDSSGRIVDWDWRFGDGSIASGTSVSHSYGSGGQYTAELTVTDDLGDSSVSSIVLDISGPAFVEQLSTGEQFVAGTVNGDYRDTYLNDGIEQAVVERTSGGRKNSRYSYLEHRWNFAVLGGDSVRLSLTGRHQSASDGDTLRFFYTVGGGPEVPLAIALGSSRSTYNVDLPAVSGQAQLIVRDSNRVSGNLDLDRLFIDALLIVTENGDAGDGGDPPPPPPPPPQDTALSANAYKRKGVQTVDLSWTGITAGSLDRNGVVIQSFTGQSGYTDTLGKGGGSYTYTLYDEAGNLKDSVSVNF